MSTRASCVALSNTQTTLNIGEVMALIGPDGYLPDAGLYGLDESAYFASPQTYHAALVAQFAAASPITHLDANDSDAKVLLTYQLDYGVGDIHSPEFGRYAIDGLPSDIAAVNGRTSMSALGMSAGLLAGATNFQQRPPFAITLRSAFSRKMEDGNLPSLRIPAPCGLWFAGHAPLGVGMGSAHRFGGGFMPTSGNTLRSSVARHGLLGMVALATTLGGIGCGPPTGPIDDAADGGVVPDDVGADAGDGEEEGEQSDGGPDVIDVLPATPLAELDLATAAGLCELYYRGGRNYIASFTQGQAPYRCDADAPLAVVAPAPFVLCEDNPDHVDFEKLAADGRIGFDQNAMIACNDTVQAATAATTLREQFTASAVVDATLTGGICDDLITGTQQAGEPCQLGWECAAGLECEVNFLVGETQCLPGAGLGETCGSNARRCGDDLTCHNDACIVGAGPGESCGSPSPCRQGLHCAEDVCVTPADEGGPCGVDFACVTGLSCVTGECVTPPAPIADGEPCLEDDRCASVCHECRNDGTGTLRCLNHGTAGDFCEDQRDCIDGLSCVDGVCHAPVGAGGACDAIACDSKSYCSSPAHVCVETRPLGGVCVANRECTSTICVDGQCRSGEDGAVCHDPFNCNELDCVRDDAAATLGVCGPFPASGPCAQGSKCADDAYCDDDAQCQAREAVGGICEFSQQCATSACVQGHCTVAAGSCLGTDASAPGVVGFYGAAWLLIRRRRLRRKRPPAKAR